MAAPKQSTPFSKVRAARAAMAESTLEMVKLFKKNVRSAIKNGDHEAAAKSIQWFLEHSADIDGARPVVDGVDKKVVDSGGPKGPTISFNFPIGGVTARPELPPAVDVIEVASVTADVNDVVNGTVNGSGTQGQE